MKKEKNEKKSIYSMNQNLDLKKAELLNKIADIRINDSELYNALKAEISEKRERKYNISKEFFDMQINSHSQDIHFKKAHILSLEKHSKIRIKSKLKMIIEEKRIIFELIE